ncbi:monooxygenase [Microdochium bolleyi]|uniref:Monooxygenase n=1 Tax=Microdochium bolleyi TaxID=196109 RepID=A0A136J3Y2_9PEZI|nr:monooxygenase [Microdochium bolleyi]
MSTSRGDLRKAYKAQPLPSVSAETLAAAAGSGDPTRAAQHVLEQLDHAVSAGDAAALEALFLSPAEGDAYWKDQVVLTSHLRTFHGPSAISKSLIQLVAQRGIDNGLQSSGKAVLLPVGPTLAFVDFRFAFETKTPSTKANGRLLLIPRKSGDELTWKIWVLSTWLEGFSDHPEDTSLLKAPRTNYDSAENINTDVFIVGGGNAAATLAARLKALGVSNVMAERNSAPGQNWSLRHDNLKFHVPTSFCTMPYLEYAKELEAPVLLGRDDLAKQLRRYIEELQLDIMTSAKITKTVYNKTSKEWTVTFMTPGGEKQAVAKHLVLATGVGSQKPYMPVIADRDLYKGLSFHASEFRNGEQLKEQGVKRVLVIGSANTGFDVTEALHAAGGMQITMNVRSPTYVCPIEYVCDPRSLGAYDAGVHAADENFLTIPSIVDGQLAKGLFGFLASQEPHRYESLRARGFPVVDGTDPEASLMHNLVERAGGHYMDHGGTKLIVDGHVEVKAHVEPAAYTATGLKFSDGSEVEADAVIWATGFADTNVQDVACEILGGRSITGTNAGVNGSSQDHILGPADIAARVEPTWGIDTEGEIRGLWKRHPELDDNFWITGGYTQLHRWHSRTLALQIRAALSGILPPAYRETPTS